MISQSKLFARTIALTLILAISGAVPAAAQVKMRDLSQDPKTGRIIVNDAPAGMSREDQIKLGQQAVQEVRKQLPLLPDNSPVTRYVQQLGQKLASKAPGEKWPFQFGVVNQAEINAFAVPGGPIFVNLGTIQMADEGELAGVIAHEISHVVLQHSARDMKKQQGAQVLGALGAMIAGAVLGNGIAGQGAAMAAQIGAGAWAMKYSRADETEADLLGAQMMYDSGYDPYSMVEFFDVLKQKYGEGGPQFLSDHPNPGNRSQTVAQVVNKFPKKNFPRSDSSQYASMKRDAMKLKPLTAQEIAQKQQRGGVQNTSGAPMGTLDPNSITPSRNMRQINGGSFAIAYPDNWQVGGDQASGMVIAPPNAVSGNAIAYGVTINQSQPARQEISIDDATNQIMQSLAESNQGLRALSSPQRIRINGRDARSVDLVAQSPLQDQGGPLRERDWLVTVKGGDNSVLVMVFTAPESDFNRLRPTYENMLRSLQLQ